MARLVFSSSFKPFPGLEDDYLSNLIFEKNSSDRDRDDDDFDDDYEDEIYE